jgi:hypothetical protein
MSPTYEQNMGTNGKYQSDGSLLSEAKQILKGSCPQSTVEELCPFYLEEDICQKLKQSILTLKFQTK